MKLSTKGRYGLKLMVDLAIHGEDKPVSIKSISQRIDVSESYLEQLIALLKKKKLVASVRGAQGGYYISKEVNNISVGEILRALEGSLAPTDCTCETMTHSCDLHKKCVTKSVWEKIRDGINEVVDNIYLDEIVVQQKEMDNLS